MSDILLIPNEKARTKAKGDRAITNHHAVPISGARSGADRYDVRPVTSNATIM
jgi:hypothetical protein